MVPTREPAEEQQLHGSERPYHESNVGLDLRTVI